MRVFYDRVWLLGRGEQYVTCGARLELYGDDEPAWREFDKRIASAHDYWFHAYRPRNGDTIVDVGAGIGWDTYVFSRAVGRRGRVLAVEAHPGTYTRLERFCNWNRLGNVRCRLAAIVDRPQTVVIDDRAAHESNAVGTGDASHSGDTRCAGSVAGNGNGHSAGRRGRGLAVPGVTLDALCAEQGLERIDFLKINIEGAERLALAGMRETLARTRCVCIAAHDFRAATAGETMRTRALVIEQLRAAGFDLSLRETDPRSFVRDHVHGLRRPTFSTCDVGTVAHARE